MHSINTHGVKIWLLVKKAAVERVWVERVLLGNVKKVRILVEDSMLKVELLRTQLTLVNQV